MGDLILALLLSIVFTIMLLTHWPVKRAVMYWICGWPRPKWLPRILWKRRDKESTQ